jgi:putative component of membrane protein insertase Oxa1/YidC/SpoIIIJ protein YidD
MMLPVVPERCAVPGCDESAWPHLDNFGAVRGVLSVIACVATCEPRRDHFIQVTMALTHWSGMNAVTRHTMVRACSSALEPQ